MHSSVSCFSVQQSGSHWVSICPCWLIIFGGNFGEFVMLSELLPFSCCCLPVQCCVSWENPDAFWESSGHGCTIKAITWLSQVFDFLFSCAVWELSCVCVKAADVSEVHWDNSHVECQWKWQFHSPLPFQGCGNWSASLWMVSACLSCGVPWWVGAGATFAVSPHTWLCLVPGTWADPWWAARGSTILRPSWMQIF